MNSWEVFKRKREIPMGGEKLQEETMVLKGATGE